MASCELSTSILDWMMIPLKDIAEWCDVVDEWQKEAIKRLKK